jgi:hypothetical protein
MPPYLPFVLIGMLVVTLLVWSFVVQGRRSGEAKETIRRLGFVPCPEKKAWLEETITRIENNRGYRYEVREPKRLPGDPTVYHYVKRRYSDENDEPMVEEEILFAVKRGAPGPVVLAVKPSSLPPGVATRLIGAVATGPWDAQPDDLQRIEIPRDLKETNLLGALGPAGAALYDVADASTLALAQQIGDAGAMFVRFRESWCTVSSTSAQIPFRLDDLIARVRPIL